MSASLEYIRLSYADLAEPESLDCRLHDGCVHNNLPAPWSRIRGTCLADL